ncbi:MAG TPA: hypothetical protein PLP83_08560, partial [Candidatus Aminicenantes bacterium]|nr:hypothetical protein [Candidatus Aminicenantes bacterium]
PATVGPWLSEADRVYGPETVFGYIDGAGEVYRSYNMRLLVARRFHKDGRPDIVVDAFDMGAPEDAFGVFTHDLDGDDAGVGQGSVYKAGLLAFWKDRYFVSVYAEAETDETRAAVVALGREVAGAIPGRGEPPGLLRALPAEGLETRTVRFLHTHPILNYHFFVADENILLLGRETGAVLAEYGEAGGRSRLLVVRHKSARRAARAGPRSAAPTCRRPPGRRRSGPRTGSGRPSGPGEGTLPSSSTPRRRRRPRGAWTP